MKKSEKIKELRNNLNRDKKIGLWKVEIKYQIYKFMPDFTRMSFLNYTSGNFSL